MVQPLSSATPTPALFPSLHAVPSPEPLRVPPSSSPQALRLVLPEKLTKPSLYGVGFGAPLGLSVVLDILGEKVLRGLLPRPTKQMALEQLKKLDARVAVFLAAPPDAWSQPQRLKDRAGLFVSITLPGSKVSWMLTVSPGPQSIQVGRGRSFPVLGGGGLVLTNAYGGQSGLGPDSPTVGRANALLATLLRVPGSKTVQGLLSNGIEALGWGAAAGSVAAAPGSGGLSLPAGAKARLFSSLLAALVKTPTFYAGPAYGITALDDKKEGLSVQRGNRPPRPIEHFGEEFSAIFAGYGGDPLNRGQRDTAVTRALWQLERSTSVFQLAAVSGGRNHGLPWLGLVNRLNQMLQKHGLLQRRPVEPLPGVLKDIPQSAYVVMHETLRNGQHATELLGKLRSTLMKSSPGQWRAFIDDIRPLARQYHLNFGLPELSEFSGAPPQRMNVEDRKIREYFLRDWNKGRTQDQRDIVPIPPQFRLMG